MSLFGVGRMCVKIAGRDAGNKCVVVEQLDNTYVLVDGATRRKKVNLKHLEPLEEVLKIKKGASHEDIKSVFEKLGLSVWDKKAKPAAGEQTKVAKVVAEEKKKRKAAVPEEKEKRKRSKTKAAESIEPRSLN